MSLADPLAGGARRAALWLLFAVALSAPTAATAVAQPDRWEAAIAAFEESDGEAPPTGRILFLGSSSIRLWDLERWFPRHRALNRGFGGSQIADSVHYFERLVTPYAPSHIVLYAGDNDIAAGKSAAQVTADFRRFRDRVRDKLPQTRILFLAIKPSLARWRLVDEMRRANQQIEALSWADPLLRFVDVATPMLGPDGRPRPELFVADGLHLSEAGYRLWTSIVAPLLPFRRDELIFPLETWHNHGSSVVELPDGDLLASWFHGSGERQADDVGILGARWRRASGSWSEPFVLADTPGFPDTNCTLLVDPPGRLWLFYPTILDNRWESALMKVRMATDTTDPGSPPRWVRSEVLHMKPGESFPVLMEAKLREYLASVGLDPQRPDGWPERTRRWVEENRERAQDKLSRRLGWFTRAHPFVLDDETAVRSGAPRLLLGLYSDGFSFSAATYSDDWGETWTMSGPIVGGGNVQPSFARRRDGTVVAFMRDNGPPPKRIQVAESSDRGATWSIARDHPELIDPGAGNEVLVLASGRWIVVHNDAEEGRHSLAISISEDEGRTFARRRHLERAAPGEGRFHYPSVIQARDGTLHVTYSYHLPNALAGGGEGKSIRHAWFNEAWLLEASGPAGGG